MSKSFFARQIRICIPDSNPDPKCYSASVFCKYFWFRPDPDPQLRKTGKNCSGSDTRTGSASLQGRVKFLLLPP